MWHLDHQNKKLWCLNSIRILDSVMLVNIMSWGFFFIDYVLVREYEELKIQQVEELDLVYILGNLSDADRQQEIFLPLAADESISMTKIGDIQEYLLHQHNSSK